MYTCNRLTLTSRCEYLGGKVKVGYLELLVEKVVGCESSYLVLTLMN